MTDDSKRFEGRKPHKPLKERRIRVGLIFGGRSGEHDVSLMSARSVMDALDREKYEVVSVGITRTGQWLAGDALAALTAGESGATRQAPLLPDPQAAALVDPERQSMELASLSEVAELDVIIPILHGPYGEDGTVQGLLELVDLPYVGAGVVGSAVGMDKAIFKSVMTANGIPILPWRLVLVSDWRSRRSAVVEELESAFCYPLFTKPANLGSSVGICRCVDRAELEAGLDTAAQYDRRIVVEQGVDARELEVAVLGNDVPIASIVGEVRPRRDFYDYVAKYVSDDSELLIPAPLDAAVADEVRDLALKAYKAIDCAGMGRVDLIMDRQNGSLYLNEINTIPGFTRISMYPKLWEASGIPYPKLLDRLIELALDRHHEKKNLKRNFRAEGTE